MFESTKYKRQCNVCSDECFEGCSEGCSKQGRINIRKHKKHWLQWLEIDTKLKYLAEYSTNLDKNYIYEEVYKQERIIKVSRDIVEFREELKMKQIEENSTLSDMGGPNAHVTIL